VYSPRLEKNIGFAMLPVEYTEFGTELEVETPQSGRVEVIVVRKPFIDAEKEVPRQQVTARTGAKTTSPT
jgi:glycine cleavage system aminomethyltransferase T